MKKRHELVIKISKLFFPYIILLIIIGFKGKLLISFILVFLHELVHFIVAKKLGFKGFYIEILPIGAVLRLKDLDEADPKEDMIISLSGPLFNLFLAAIFYLISKFHYNYYYEYLVMSNLALGIFNLIPAFPLDGGRIVRDLFSFKTYYKNANKITVKISIVLGVLITLYSLILLIFDKRSISMMVLGVFIIIASYKEKERIVYLIMGDIINKKYKFNKKGYIENRSISMHLKKSLLEALSIIDKNKYNIFIILNSEMKAVNVIYEGELIEAIKIYGNISIEEYLKNTDEIDKMDKFAKKTIDQWNSWNNECNKDI
ncbi:stage IV sporulation protein FB [Clostridium homopropionicum DSM 5847]|uniref:Stage IV sporulation protein FB n=1 Tax=Clostridium homopropionicum DSM 5847 TaxID=1121318 RepID=A0A0L6ZEA6_9CLOT|nr:M50 family metallopeptidase [Clostridium homopropionicum]KOA21277.1 stage IV sporulation protein FB [Clostridium homopropionicum DSM 5847]SFG29661.1 stage IV sporulation protein FB [Clostridium homopropionicum]